MKKLLLAALALVVLASVGTADAQSQPWQRVHGYVVSVQGPQAVVRASDDGRFLTVDTSQVSESVRRALEPGEGVTLVGFQGAQPHLFTARYIQQESSNVSRGGVVRGRTTGSAQQIVGLIPQFLASQEFQAAGINVRDPGAASMLVTRMYRSFFERVPSPQEVQGWADRLHQSGDLRGVLEAFMTSPEYTSKSKGVDQGIVDLYQGVLGRIPSQAEVDGWKQRLAQR